MGKNKLRGVIVLAILLVLFSVVAFVIPFEKTPSLYIGYVFGVIAILSQIYFFRSSFDGETSAKSRFYGFPIARIGVIYLGVQLVISVAEMATSWFLPTWVSLVVDLFVLCLAAIGCIGAEIMRDEIQVQDQKLKKNVSNMRELQSLANSLVGICEDTEIKKELEKLAEKFRYSDPVSSEKTEEMEKELKVQLSEVQKMIINKEYKSLKSIISKIIIVLDERNRVCSIYKRF